MIRNSLLTALCATTIAYLSLTLAFSTYGILEFKRHSEYALQLQENVEALERNNERLLRRIEDLRTLSDVVVLEGRGIGLYRPDEGVVRVAGYPNPARAPESASPGRMMHTIREGRNNYPWIRAVALSIGLLVFAFGISGGRRTPRRTWARVALSPRYDSQHAPDGRTEGRTESREGAFQPRKVS